MSQGEIPPPTIAETQTEEEKATVHYTIHYPSIPVIAGLSLSRDRVSNLEKEAWRWKVNESC